MSSVDGEREPAGSRREPVIGSAGRPRAARVVLAAVSVAAAAVGGFAVGRAGVSPGLGEQLAPLCSRWADQVESVELPGSLDDPVQLSAMAAAAAAVHDQALTELSDVATDETSRGDLQRLVGQLERRRELWTDLSGAPGDLDVELVLSSELVRTWDGSFTELGAPGCDRVALPGGVGAVLDERRLSWARELDMVCERVMPSLSELDTAAGASEVTVGDYLREFGQRLAELDTALDSIPEVDRTLVTLSQDRWSQAVRGTADAARAGDLARARAGADRWATLDSGAVPGRCHIARAISPTAPSGAVVGPVLDGVPATGVEAGQVIDPTGVARNLGEVLSSPAYSGVDPTFVLGRVLEQYPLGGGAVDGGIEPGPDQVSVRVLDPADASVAASPGNPRLVALAVRGVRGGCAGIVVEGFPRPDRFREVPGACTADAALGSPAPRTPGR